jgi:hypothetical protein
MKPSTQNKIAGKFHEAKGKMKQKVGQLSIPVEKSPLCRSKIPHP